MGLLDQNTYQGGTNAQWADYVDSLKVTPMSFTPMDAARFVAEATPIIGDAMAAKEVYDELQKPDPNYAMVAALGGAALVGLVPGLGDAMAAGIKKGARGLLDTAKRIEVDPNALGMSGGNIRLKPKGSIQDAIRLKYPEVSVDLFGDSEKGYELSKIVVPKGSREQGTGTKVMEDILSLVDAQGARVSLTPDSAFGGSKPRLKKFYKKFGFVDNKGVNKDFTTRNTMYRNPVMPTLSLPNPRNEAEAMAKKVLEMRASGNARDVTEKMMNAADDQYMFKNTPIPMDVSSRMARADEMNPRKGFHGTNADIQGFEGNVFSTDNPTLASTYARGISDGQIYPLRLGSKFGDTIVEGAGADWHKMNINDIKDPSVQSWLDWAEGQKISTREIENAARKEGRSGVQFKNIKDTGPGINSSQFKNIGYTKEQERDLQRQYMKDLSNPSNVDVRLSPNLVRSQFARFDPEFKHLKNLTAAGLLTPGVLAAMQEYKKHKS